MNDYLTTIDEIAEIFDGPHATPSKTSNGPYFLSISSLKNGTLDLTESAYLSDDDYIKWTKRVTPKEGDLLFSYETRLGEAALMPKGIKACLGRRMGLLRPKKDKVISEYLLYAYLSPTFQGIIKTNTIRGATVNRISLNQIPKFKIRIPPLKQQQSLVGVLTSLDAKIELNKRINAELEAMAKTMYDYWFVQFDFPDKNGKPYKSSGGKMVWNKELKREIPEGWEVKKLGNVLDTSLGGTPSTHNKSFWENGTYNWLNSGEVAEFPIVSSELKITKEAIEKSATDLLPKGTTLLSITRHLRPTILAIYACANQSVVGIKEKGDIKSCYIYPYLKNEIPRFLVLRTGAQQPHINKETVDSSLMILPSDNSTILNDYNKIAGPLYNQIINNAFQNQHLSSLRDWLLPMLMNGQVKVS